jgi:hypothetical protein
VATGVSGGDPVHGAADTFPLRICLELQLEATLLAAVGRLG